MVPLNSPFHQCHWCCSIWVHEDFNVVSIPKLLHSIWVQSGVHFCVCDTESWRKRGWVFFLLFCGNNLLMAFDSAPYELKAFSKRHNIYGYNHNELWQSNICKSFTVFTHICIFHAYTLRHVLHKWIHPFNIFCWLHRKLHATNGYIIMIMTSYYRMNVKKCCTRKETLPVTANALPSIYIHDFFLILYIPKKCSK